MERAQSDIDLPPDWRQAVAQAAAARRVVVVGATDMGKSTFIRHVVAAADAQPMLIDLDPGQKMIGPPGTVALGRLEPLALDRFIFVGSTGSSAISTIARAAAELADSAGRSVANTSGFVTGLGARLQAATVASLKPDLVVEIAADLRAPPLISAPSTPLLRVATSPAARRKSAGARARLRQMAFETALAGAMPLVLRRRSIRFDPAPPAPFDRPVRPVCALADEEGRDVSYGVLEAYDDETVAIAARPADVPLCLVRLGRMWAKPGESEWRLEERLSPSWIAESA